MWQQGGNHQTGVVCSVSNDSKLTQQPADAKQPFEELFWHKKTQQSSEAKLRR
jgi:hypothetical protein